MNTCKHCGNKLGADTVVETMVRLLRENPRRDIYQAQDGLYYYTYRDMSLPEISLNQEEVDQAVKDGLLRLKYPGSYRVAGAKP